MTDNEEGMKAAEIRVKESILVTYAADLAASRNGAAYRPLSAGNMSYSRANSINDLRTAIMESIEPMDLVSQLVEKDANRLKKMGQAFTEMDLAASQSIQELEVR